MDDKYKTKKQLIRELEELRRRVRELEDMESEDKLLSELKELEEEDQNWPEKDLHELEKRYQALIETNLYGIQEIDIYGIITYMNSIQYKILGYNMGELKGKQIWDLLASDAEREQLTEYLTKIAEGEYTSFPWTGKYLRKDDKIVELQVDWNYRQDSHGRIMGFISVISGILGANPAYDNFCVETDKTDAATEPDVSQEDTPDAPSDMTLKLDEIQHQLENLQQAIFRENKIHADQNVEIKNTSDDDAESPLKVPANIFSPQLMAKILQRLDLLHHEFESKFKNDTHKNKIIDNLHQDLQDYKNDFLKKYLKTVIMDVIQIADNIRKLANHYSSQPLSQNDSSKLLDILQNIPSDLEDLFYRHGVKSFTCEGNTFDPTRQRVLKTQETSDESKDKTVAQRLRPGYEWDGKIIRPEMVIAYIYKAEKE